MAEITIEGLDDTLEKIERINDPKATKAGLTASAMVVQRHIATYPPKPAHSTYRREGLLGRSWTIKVTAEKAIIGNNVSYAPFVQKDRSFPKPHQASWHAGRWQTDKQVVTRHETEINRAFEKGYFAYINKR